MMDGFLNHASDSGWSQEDTISLLLVSFLHPKWTPYFVMQQCHTKVAKIADLQARASSRYFETFGNVSKNTWQLQYLIQSRWSSHTDIQYLIRIRNMMASIQYVDCYIKCIIHTVQFYFSFQGCKPKWNQYQSYSHHGKVSPKYHRVH